MTAQPTLPEILAGSTPEQTQRLMQQYMLASVQCTVRRPSTVQAIDYSYGYDSYTYKILAQMAAKAAEVHNAFLENMESNLGKNDYRDLKAFRRNALSLQGNHGAWLLGQLERRLNLKSLRNGEKIDNLTKKSEAAAEIAFNALIDFTILGYGYRNGGYSRELMIKIAKQVQERTRFAMDKLVEIRNLSIHIADRIATVNPYEVIPADPVNPIIQYNSHFTDEAQLRRAIEFIHNPGDRISLLTSEGSDAIKRYLTSPNFDQTFFDVTINQAHALKQKVGISEVSYFNAARMRLTNG